MIHCTLPFERFFVRILALRQARNDILASFRASVVTPEWYSWCMCAQSRYFVPFPDRTFIYRALQFKLCPAHALLASHVGFHCGFGDCKVPFGLSRLSYRRPRLWLFRG